jgi:hypothetical protein
VVDRVLDGLERLKATGDAATLSDRERAFCQLVLANTAAEEVRAAIVRDVATRLTVEEIYHANAVVALFNFYNTFVDLNGVDPLTPDGYRASGVRLSTQGYAPPAGAGTNR